MSYMNHIVELMYGISSTHDHNSGKDTQAKANAKCALPFPEEEAGRRAAEAEKKRKHA